MKANLLLGPSANCMLISAAWPLASCWASSPLSSWAAQPSTPLGSFAAKLDLVCQAACGAVFQQFCALLLLTQAKAIFLQRTAGDGFCAASTTTFLSVRLCDRLRDKNMSILERVSGRPVAPALILDLPGSP